MLVEDCAGDIDVRERFLAHKLQPRHHHARDPQKNNVAGGHQHARRAIAALERVLGGEGRSQRRGDGIVVEPLDRADIARLAIGSESDAGAHGLAVKQERAGTADAVLTSQMRTSP